MEAVRVAAAEMVAMTAGNAVRKCRPIPTGELGIILRF